jgi:DNA-3-methyladenine glycosylase II
MKYHDHLSKDKQLKKLIKQVGKIKLVKRDQVYLRLCESIVSQQLSVKAADTIYGRFLALFGDTPPTPQQILDTSIEDMRAAGLSRPKASYLHNVARFELEEGMDPLKLGKMSNEEAIAYLTRIKGVGQWTVEMLLMFVLAREDVFAVDDIGLQNAMVKLYDLNRKHKRFKKQILKISEEWSPYRTYASIYLWRYKDK